MMRFRRRETFASFILNELLIRKFINKRNRYDLIYFPIYELETLEAMELGKDCKIYKYELISDCFKVSSTKFFIKPKELV